MVDQREFTVVRVKLGPDKVAPQPDPLGRARIGFAPELSAADPWDRGRGLWRARLDKVADAQLLLITSAGTVVLVGTVTGVSFHDGRVAITGTPDPRHPLIGQPDPLDNSSPSPIAYGTLETVPASPPAQRPFDVVLDDAIAVLTEAGRRRRPRLYQTPAGRMEPHPTDTDPADWAEFVTLTLAGAAANLAGIGAALAGRPGSWEAAKVEDLLYAVIGEDPAGLWQHRTEPVQLAVDVDGQLREHTDAWEQYENADAELDDQLTAAAEADPYPDQALYGWVYTVTGPDQVEPVDPAAPAWSWDRWRSFRRPEWAEWDQSVERDVHIGDTFFVTSLFIPNCPEAAAEYDRLSAERDARLDVLNQQVDQLAAQKQREWDAYGSALTEALQTQTQGIPGLRVPVKLSITTSIDSDMTDDLNPDPLLEQLLDAAVTARRGRASGFQRPGRMARAELHLATYCRRARSDRCCH
jgi:hypothetical protein